MASQSEHLLKCGKVKFLHSKVKRRCPVIILTSPLSLYLAGKEKQMKLAEFEFTKLDFSFFSAQGFSKRDLTKQEMELCVFTYMMLIEGLKLSQEFSTRRRCDAASHPQCDAESSLREPSHALLDSELSGR